MPLHHPPGHAQVDFGEAVVEVGGRREKVAFFCLILPHSNVWFVKAYPRETTEAFLDGHVSAFAFLGGVPRSILYDNTTLAVARILGDGTRRRTQAFSHLQSHYLFRDRFGRPGKGNDKGKVEALVKTARRRFMVPIPKVHDLSVLNERLMARCLERLDALEAGEKAAALLADLEALRDLPAVPFEACEHVPGQVSSTALVRYRLVDYPTGRRGDRWDARCCRGIALPIHIEAKTWRADRRQCQRQTIGEHPDSTIRRRKAASAAPQSQPVPVDYAQTAFAAGR